LYNVIGRRLGLDLRGMVQPGHAFSILYDGNRQYEVQTTCARGFDPKDPTVQKELEAKAGIKPSASRNNCREIREVALLTVICSNRTAEFVKDNRYYEALLVGFLGLALDPTNQTAVDNTDAAWTKWTKDLIDQGQFEKVMAVVAVGRGLAPKNASLLCNRDAAWDRWIETTLAQGGEEASRKLIRQLWKENSKDRDFQNVVRNHVVRTLHKSLTNAKGARDYKAALAVIDRHREFLRDESEARYMSHAVYDTWAQPLIKAGKWAEAIEVYQGALAVYPGDAHLSQNLEYCQQESKKQSSKK
jgi:tetratricopeptide (TPR) repeat protein